MAALNLETFNNILFGAFKEQTPEKKIELIKEKNPLFEDLFQKAKVPSEHQ